MKLVADSGSTKTDWFLTDGNKVVKEFKTSGVNPMVQDEELVRLHLSEVLEYVADTPVSMVYFYGAGCSEDSNKDVVRRSLRLILKDPEVMVENDLMGAAISLFGNVPGIVCIIGTGSNCCSFDGTKITDARHGIGYILGDEASGAYFGRLLIRDYLYQRLDKSIARAIDEKFGLSREQILAKVYKGATPNRFLAGFSLILSENLGNEYVNGIVKRGIDEFIESNVLCYPRSKELSTGFTGSVAYAFRDVIIERMERAHLKTGTIIKRPIEGLKKFHTH